ncbi:MAG: hypothetical protein KF773_24265 [Deltaproteobacteria bacterium]|nr:hypothetical protein [Deltaproteobacteria bacterium]
MEIVDHDEFAGQTIAWIGHFTDKTSERSIESLQHMGWKGEDLAELGELGRDACAHLLPAVVELVIEPDQRQDGTWQNRVRWVNRAGGKFAFKKPLQGADLKAFSAQMRSTVRSVRGAVGATRSVPGSGQRAGGGSSAHPNAPGTSDEVPF